MVIISVLTLGWMMEETEHLRHFVYLCKAIGLVMRLVCAGKCGDGLEGDLFTCGGCGGETAQGVDDRTSPRSVSCGGGGAVWALQQFGELQRSELLLTHAHTTCGVGLGVDCVNLQMIHMSIKVCVLRSQSLLMLLMLIFPWCPCELTTSSRLTSIDTSHPLPKAAVRMRPLSFGSLRVNQQISLQSQANDRLQYINPWRVVLPSVHMNIIYTSFSRAGLWDSEGSTSANNLFVNWNLWCNSLQQVSLWVWQQCDTT